MEISGQIGFSALEGMKVIIDYRDGLVQFVGNSTGHEFVNCQLLSALVS